MALRQTSKVIAALTVIAVCCFMILCSMCRVDAMVDPTPEEENARAAAASPGTQSQSQTASSSKKSKTKTTNNSNAGSGNGNGSNRSNSNSGSSSGSSGSNSNSDSRSGSGSGSDSGSDSDDDEDVLDENAFSTPGNATLGDMVKSSGSKDFYTIRTDNDNTFYLVIDHAGTYDNVYMLSTIDENDLKDFLEDEDSGSGSGSLILPENEQAEDQESTVKTPEKEQDKNRLPGIISLVLLIAAGIAGIVIYRRSRGAADEPDDDYSENMEDDGFPTVNEDEEFLE